MNWETIFTTQRTGQSQPSDGPRSGFQRDFDRLIFSSAFRRLQNKTQVFPLPGSTFVHNRLTHSLEVASVGRSLGSMVGKRLCEQFADTQSDSYEFYKYELANVIAAGCLAHDIGNPAFGHSGEKAISAYFIDNAKTLIDGKELRSFFTDVEWADISNFEGNANAIRILTHNFKGRLGGGLGLTYTTIASILKYPCEATGMDASFKHRKKYGFFQSEKETITQIAEVMGMQKEGGDSLCYNRHPYVYLVEAADDICYKIVDVEDAHRLGILTHTVVRDVLLGAIEKVNRAGEDINKILATYNRIGDENERVSYLRAKAINIFTLTAVDVFCDHQHEILKGTFNDTLVDNIDDSFGAFKEIFEVSVDKIYNHDTVLEVEIAGYNVMSELLSLFVPALLKEKPSHKDKKVLQLFPLQFREFETATNSYSKVLNVLDTISGMTDLFATELYKKLKGIDIPQHQ